jgi:hypothetical protein
MPQSVVSKVPEPPSVGAIYLLDKSNQKLNPLPDEPFKVGHNNILEPPITGSLDVQGSRSPFRLTDTKPEFVFKFETPESAVLYMSASKKNERRFISIRLEKDNRFAKVPGVPIEISSYGESSYKLVPSSPLSVGEYAITLEQSPQAVNRRIFTFGID